MQQDSLTHALPLPTLNLQQEADAIESQATLTHKPRQAKRLAAQPDTTHYPIIYPLREGTPSTLPSHLPKATTPIDSLYFAYHHPFLSKLDSLAGHPQLTCTTQRSGIAGDPVPYQFRTDNIVTIILLTSFFLAIWVIAHSKYFIQQHLTHFFKHRKRQNLFAQRTQNELRGQLFLIFQTCFVIGLLFFDYTQEYQVRVFNSVSPYRILCTSVAISALYYLIKIVVYQVVNHTFFPKADVTQWTDAYLLSVLVLGIVLLPITLLMVYFDLPFHLLAILTTFILVVDKLLLLYKTYQIFFPARRTALHLFLYFCTLEIVPLLTLFRALGYANAFLLSIN